MTEAAAAEGTTEAAADVVAEAAAVVLADGVVATAGVAGVGASDVTPIVLPTFVPSLADLASG